MQEDQISVSSKEIQIHGEAALARLLSVEGQEGMLSTHLAELVNTSQSAMRQHIKNHAISAQALPAHSLRGLHSEIMPSDTGLLALNSGYGDEIAMLPANY